MQEDADTLNATIRTRANFAVAHMKTAAQAARNAQKHEQANAGTEHGPWFDEMLMLVPVSVVMAVAALEANVNEVIQDALDSPDLISLSASQKVQLRKLLNDRSGDPISKYETLALVLGRVPDKGSEPWQLAQRLVEFRNHFIHFRPAWDDADIHDSKFVTSLKAAKISVYPPYANDFQFPYGFMTYGCAKWAVNTALTFADKFSGSIDLNNRFAKFSTDWALP